MCQCDAKVSQAVHEKARQWLIPLSGRSNKLCMGRRIRDLHCCQGEASNAVRLQDRLPASLRRLVLVWGPLGLRTGAECQALYTNAAAALGQLPLLRHLVIQRLYSTEGLPASLLADAVDSLPSLRSLHLLSCETCIAPLLGCLSRLDSFSQTQCKVQVCHCQLSRPLP